MTTGAWDEIYREEILDHYKHPRHRGTLENPDITYEDANPLCGDHLRMDLRVKDGRVEATVGVPFQNTRMSSVSTPGFSKHS